MWQKVMIIGNLGSDPEMRYTPSGVPVTSFNVAVNRRWKAPDGTMQDKTTWFRVTAWRQLAETCNQYLSKGRQVMVEGEVESGAFLAQDGTARGTLELTARDVRFLGGRGDTLAPGAGAAGGSYAGGSRPAGRPAPSVADEFAPPGDLHDEDIPF
jgi:single-strand DNA-binding protein